MSHRSASHGRVASMVRVSAAIVVASLMTGSVAYATDYTFTAASGTPASYSIAANWTPVAVPGSSDAAFIAGGRIATIATGFTGSVNSLNLGANGNTGTGELQISGGGLTVAGAQLGHDAGTDAGTLTITGGSFSSTGNFVMGEQGTGDNKVVISAGTLSLSNENYLGANGKGSILISGTANVTLGRQDVGNAVNSTGILSVSGGTVSMLGDTYVGLRGAGTFTISGGNINTGDVNPGALRIGQENETTARGIVNVTGGTSIFSVVVMGEQSRQDNQLNISGGTFTDRNDLYNGANGKGAVTISGASTVVNIGSQMHIGAGTTGNGSLSLSGGTLNMTGNGDGAWILVGQNGTGTFSNTGGAITTNRFAVGQDPNSTGTGNMSAGSLRSKLTLVVGETTQANNVLNITGGTAEIGTDGADADGNGIFVGSYSGKGTLNISGTAGVSVHNGITIGYGAGSAADGTINVNGGLLTTLNTGDQGRVRIGVYGGSTGKLNIAGGAASFAGPILNGVAFGGEGVGGTGTVTFSSGSLTAAGMVNETGSTYSQSGGTATLGTVSGGGSMTISGGTANVTRITQSALTVNGTGIVKVANATSPTASIVSTLTTGGTGKLDLSNNGLIVDYTGATSPIASIRAALAAGQIVGNLSPADTRQGIAYAEASTLGVSSFLGTPVDTTSIVLRSRLKGDANLNGTVDFNDLVSLSQSYNTMSGAVWTMGDFNYDGKVDFNDLVPLAQNYNGSLSSVDFGSASFQADWALAQAVAPEPASLAVMLAGGALVSRRRRR